MKTTTLSEQKCWRWSINDIKFGQIKDGCAVDGTLQCNQDHLHRWGSQTYQRKLRFQLCNQPSPPVFHTVELTLYCHACRDLVKATASLCIISTDERSSSWTREEQKVWERSTRTPSQEDRWSDGSISFCWDSLSRPESLAGSKADLNSGSPESFA